MSKLKSYMDENGEGDTEESSVPGGDAMQRALTENYSAPPALVQQGIAHLNDPNNGLSYEQKMEAIVPLLQAKHFGGPQGAKISGFQPGAQGQIDTSNNMNHGILGFFNKLTGGVGGAKKLGVLNSSAGAGGAAEGASAAEAYGGAATGATAGGDAGLLFL